MAEWIELAVGILLLMSGTITACWLSFTQGVKMGREMRPVNAPYRRTSPPAVTQPNEPSLPCTECGIKGGHHLNCPNGQPKERRIGKPWLGFSRAKRELEGKETA